MDTLPRQTANSAASGAISGFVGVLLGAFGAHVLRDRIAADMLQVFETGVRYQLYHALALLASHSVLTGRQGKILSAWWVSGTVLFSGSLYVLALSGVRALGMITPFGGACFLIGWIYLLRSSVIPRTGG